VYVGLFSVYVGLFSVYVGLFENGRIRTKSTRSLFCVSRTLFCVCRAFSRVCRALFKQKDQNKEYQVSFLFRALSCACRVNKLFSLCILYIHREQNPIYTEKRTLYTQDSVYVEHTQRTVVYIQREKFFSLCM